MYALISYPAGIIVEAVIVNRSRNRLRVVAAGFSDAFELRCVGTQWLTDGGEPVELEFVATAAPFAGKAASQTALVRGAGSMAV
jgi:hypothetical protein